MKARRSTARSQKKRRSGQIHLCRANGEKYVGAATRKVKTENHLPMEATTRVSASQVARAFDSTGLWICFLKPSYYFISQQATHRTMSLGICALSFLAFNDQPAHLLGFICVDLRALAFSLAVVSMPQLCTMRK